MRQQVCETHDGELSLLVREFWCLFNDELAANLGPKPRERVVRILLGIAGRERNILRLNLLKRLDEEIRSNSVDVDGHEVHDELGEEVHELIRGVSVQAGQDTQEDGLQVLLQVGPIFETEHIRL